MDLKALLADEGLPLDETILLRHADRGRLRPPYSLWKNDRLAFERHQSMQLPRNFDRLHNAPYWVAFGANEMAETVFLGVYEAREPTLVDPPLANEVDDGFTTVPHFVFHTTLLPNLAWLRGELKVRWGGDYINWLQPALGSAKELESMTAASSASDEHDTMRELVPYAPPLSPWSAVDRRPGTAPSRPVDAITWMIRVERRSADHEVLLRRVAAKAAGRAVECSQLIDLVVDRDVLIEVKSLEDDVITQVRAALAQLYHYRFVYRETLPAAKLLVVFGRRPLGGHVDLVAFLESCSIAVAWGRDGDFDGTEAARAAVPWLFR